MKTSHMVHRNKAVQWIFQEHCEAPVYRDPSCKRKDQDPTGAASHMCHSNKYLLFIGLLMWAAGVIMSSNVNTRVWEAIY